MEPHNQNRKDLLVLFLIIVAGAVVAVALWFFYGQEVLEEDFSFEDLGMCNVIALDIHGCIVTYVPDPNFYISEECDAFAASEELYMHLKSAKEDGSVKAVLLDIDSAGGYPQAALEIEAGVKELGKPSVALIRAYGDSAAYWVASAADTIVASEESDVGSIGASMSFIDYSAQNIDTGVTYNAISSGRFKDTGDPNKPLTEEEREYLQASVQATFEHFVETVAENRGLSIEAVRALADGSSVLGKEAFEKGLIDRIGSFKEADEELERLIGEKPVLCWTQYGE